MSTLTRAELKAFFETGDQPTEAQFAAFIDGVLNLEDDANLLGSFFESNPGTYGDILSTIAAIKEFHINNDGQGLTTIKVKNEDNAENYAGAIFVCKGSGPAFTRNIYLAFYGDSFYITSWQGKGVLASDSGMRIANVGSETILFQGGADYNNLKDLFELNQDGTLLIKTPNYEDLVTLDNHVPNKKYVDFEEISEPPELAAIKENKFYIDTTNNKVYLKKGGDSFTFNLNPYAGPPINITGDDVGGEIPDDAPSTIVNFTLDPVLTGSEGIKAHIDPAPGQLPDINSANYNGSGGVVVDFGTTSPGSNPGIFGVYFTIDGQNTNTYLMQITASSRTITGDNVGGDIPDETLQTDVNFTISPPLSGGESLSGRIENAAPGVNVIIEAVSYNGGAALVSFNTAPPNEGHGSFEIVLTIDGQDTNFYPMEVLEGEPYFKIDVVGSSAQSVDGWDGIENWDKNAQPMIYLRVTSGGGSPEYEIYTNAADRDAEIPGSRLAHINSSGIVTELNGSGWGGSVNIIGPANLDDTFNVTTGWTITNANPQQMDYNPADVDVEYSMSPFVNNGNAFSAIIQNADPGVDASINSIQYYSLGNIQINYDPGTGLGFFEVVITIDGFECDPFTMEVVGG
jgi:hypothetical protein